VVSREPLASVLRTLRTETSAVPEIREHAIEWHAKILIAVTEGDGDAAREMMRGHLIQTEDDTEHFLGHQQVAQSAEPLAEGLLDDVAVGRAEDHQVVDHRSRVARPVKPG